MLRAEGRVELPHHSILFASDSKAEFDALFARTGAFPEESTVYVCHPAATDPTMAPTGGGASRLYAMIYAPPLAPGASLEPELLARLRAQCLARVVSQWPALRGRLEVIGDCTPEDFQRQGAPGGSIYGFLPHGLFGPFRRPRIRGPMPGLFFAGGGTHPGGGVPLAMLSGTFAAQLAHRDLVGTRRAAPRAA